jgi:hypothetical protein
MKKQLLLTLVVAFGFPLTMTLVPVCQAQSGNPKDFVAPAVFQAAGPKATDPTAISIQSAVDAFRAALGDPNNLNNAGPLAAVVARSTGMAPLGPTLPQPQ